ncbi:hypothetical protein GGS20DRAFT_557271 [Poronia punctata]|nr:hypothetical protein GGS20DRAFT_557271 [Poronia punctata]
MPSEGKGGWKEGHTGPVIFLNPTTGRIPASVIRKEDAKIPADDAVHFLYRSRDNRKGRHAVVVLPQGAGKQGIRHPAASNTLKESLRGILKMSIRYPVWDVSYNTAVFFTLGSVVWVINAFFVWLPSQYPSTEFPGEVDNGGGISALVGTTLFEIGSVFLMLEAINTNRTDCFGWALDEFVESHGPLLRADPESCRHHHADRHGLYMKEKSSEGSQEKNWKWWPSWSELKSHYLREIGFLASLSQFIGATIFWICGFASIPFVYSNLSEPVENGVYWVPQVVGGVGFIISSWLFMLETQKTWYRPAPKVLGWHVGFWNLVGSFGFTVCGALGFASENKAASYGSGLSTFIGSLAFLIGSLVQWYESLSKYPISLAH